MSRRPGDPAAISRSLQADCASCFGLCCVALGFLVSADFAMDKPAGEPCPHLDSADRCGIHDQLRPRGFKGCAAYDCFGAGQQVAQRTFGGRSWREAPETAAQMFAAFGVMRQLHESLWHLRGAVGLVPAGELQDELQRALDDTDRLSDGTPEALLALDVESHRAGCRTC